MDSLIGELMLDPMLQSIQNANRRGEPFGQEFGARADGDCAGGGSTPRYWQADSQ